MLHHVSMHSQSKRILQHIFVVDRMQCPFRTTPSSHEVLFCSVLATLLSYPFAACRMERYFWQPETPAAAEIYVDVADLPLSLAHICL